MLIFNPVILFCNSVIPSYYSFSMPLLFPYFFKINFFLKYTHDNLYTDIYGTKLLVTVIIIIVHPESGRSNAQNAIAFSRRNLPRINCSGEFACVYFRLRARTCVQSYV